ncbi:MAG: MmcQ/YjbR family DNA-binding protein [Helicobacteraceae bacterium]|jgi:predicted DNA-binding protein (MmcQ/YjbR family)|nr:MmcQ/YjbR family DNA-binding protein [Helicobacteraceae bacterium]
MTLETIEKLALKQKWATKDYKPTWDSTLYRIGGKIFILVMHDEKNPMMNFKNDPFVNIHLREKYPDITAAYHMNKKHWNTLFYKDSEINVSFLEQIIRESYEIVLNSLSKNKRRLLETS